MNAKCLARSGRSSVTLKKNRSAETVALIFACRRPSTSAAAKSGAHPPTVLRRESGQGTW
jgi:hypothetical protein